MIKLISMDLDGTYFTSDNKHSNKNIEVLKECIKKGIYVVINTGRLFNTLDGVIEELGLDKTRGYAILNTGASVQSTDTGELLFSESLTKQDYLDILKYTAKYPKVQLTAYTSSSIYGPNEEPNSGFAKDLSTLKLPVLSISTMKDDIKIDRINIMGEDKDIQEAVNSIPNSLLDKYFYVQNGWFSFEILNKNANKGNGLEKVAKYLNIQKEYILAIGDGNNDISMYNYAGYKVAMENAKEKLKEVAEYITKSNDEDGVAYIIEKLIFKKQN